MAIYTLHYRTYRSWQSMFVRCYDRENKSYFRYGGRGVSVCGRWTEFKNFLADMGEKPSQQHSIDRIDNNGNYEPGNCRWATPLQQRLNRPDLNMVVVGGEVISAAELAHRLGQNVAFVVQRAKRGWSGDRIAATPTPQKHRRKDLTGMKFGLLTAREPAGRYKTSMRWLCDCDCGGTKVVVAHDLKRKHKPTKSCGCLIGNNAKRLKG